MESKNNKRHMVLPISVKFLLEVLLVVFLIELFFFVLNARNMAVMQEQINVSIESILESGISTIENRMGTSVKLLSWAKNENVNSLAMLKMENYEWYEFYRNVLYGEVEDMQELMEGADVYFFSAREREEILLWRSAKLVSREASMSFIKEVYAGELQKNCWNLGSLDGLQVLYLAVETKDVYYGGWLYLDDVLEQLRADVQYERDRYSITRDEGEEQEGAIKISARSKTGNFYINAYLDEGEIRKEIVGSLRYLWIEILMVLFAFVCIYILIYRSFIIPLKRLNTAMHHVERGDLEHRILEKGESIEQEQVYKGFNTMVENIQELICEKYEKQLVRERLEQENLKLKIKPHFLLNTYNLIYMLCQMGKNDEVQEVILYLSAYTRYLFRSDRNLELFQKEDQLIKDYIKIAQLQYPGCIAITYFYDPEIMMVRLPQLLVYNFVENIVKHVVRKGSLIHISIVGQCEKEAVSFMIMDDGQGMSKAKIAELQDSMRGQQSDGKHMGFSSSLKRLKYYYGEDADIRIDSEEGKGTCVTVFFPYHF